jgi:hypothetical protein
LNFFTNRQKASIFGSLIFTFGLALSGCGDSGNNLVFPNTNDAGLVNGALPPGTVIAKNTGPVLNSDQAVQRFLSQYLTSSSPIVSQKVIGIGSQALVNAYLVPSGPFQAGAAISDADDKQVSFTLDQPYYLFWVDPDPLANLGHSCALVYMRASDGLLVEQRTDFDPKVDQSRPLELPSVKLANLIYSHEEWQKLSAIPAPVLRVNPSSVLARDAGVGEANGPRIGGLGIAGAPEARRGADLDAGETLFKEMGGTSAGFMRLVDTEGERASKSKLETALSEASSGLGADDKFVLILSSHGSPDGRFQLGTDLVTWEELCMLLEQKVTAGNVNLVLDTCFAGTSVDAFEKWKNKTGKRFRLLTSTDRTPSYSRANGLGLNYECALEAIRKNLAKAKEDGTLTLDELEQAFSDAKFTLEDVTKKMCELVGDVPGGNPPASLKQWKNDFENDLGEKDKVAGTSAGVTLGFTGSPDLINVGPPVSATHTVGVSPCPQDIGSLVIGNNTNEDVSIEITFSSPLIVESPTSFVLQGNLGATTRDVQFDCSTQTSFEADVTIKATRLSDGAVETETVKVRMTIVNQT